MARQVFHREHLSDRELQCDKRYGVDRDDGRHDNLFLCGIEWSQSWFLLHGRRGKHATRSEFHGGHRLDLGSLYRTEDGADRESTHELPVEPK